MRASLIVTLAALTIGSSAQAADAVKESWKGRLVVGKKPAEEITFGDNSTGEQVYFKFKGFYPITVRDEREGWIRIFDGHREGWADKDEFILSRDAVAYFTKRIRANASDSFALWMRGVAWKDRQEYDNAIKDYTECIRLDPERADAFNGRGVAWHSKTENDKAIRDYDEAIRLDPKFASPFNNRGIAWRSKKEYDKAIRDYDEAIRLDAKFAVAFNNRGVAWWDKKEYGKAIKNYDEAIRLDPKYAPAFNNRGWSYYLRANYDKALADFDRCLKLDPKNAFATGNRGLVFAARKEYSAAVKSFEAALGLEDATYPPYEYAAFLASCPDGKYRDGKRAVTLAKKAMEIKGEGAGWEVRAAMAAAYAEAGDYEQAIVTQRAALDDKTCTGDDRKRQEARLESYRQKKPYRAE